MQLRAPSISRRCRSGRPATKPLYLSVLRPAEGASTIPLGEASPHLLAVEQRVGRGRITMLTINPARAGAGHLAGARYAGPPGRPPPPEESQVGPAGITTAGLPGPLRGTAGRSGPDLVPDHQPRRAARSGHRGPLARSRPEPPTRPAPPAARRRFRLRSPRRPPLEEEDPAARPTIGVADWRDSRGSPRSAATCSRRLPASPSPARIRAEGDPRLPDRRRPAELADLPLRPQSPRVGLDRRPAGRLRLRHRRAARGRLRHGVRLGLR